MSIIKADQIQNLAGNQISVEPATGSAPLYAARAWVNFDGQVTSNQIREAKNVSSIGDLGGAIFQINFTDSMPDTDYAIVGNAFNSSSDQHMLVVSGHSSNVSFQTNNCNVYTYSVNAHGAVDATHICVAIFR